MEFGGKFVHQLSTWSGVAILEPSSGEVTPAQ